MPTHFEPNSPEPHYLTMQNGDKLAYHSHLQDKVSASEPGVIFLCGHGSDMNGTKALTLQHMAETEGFGFTRFDYFGHGASDGDFLEGTISRWTDDCLAILDAATTGPQILVGSSLGGWVMLTAALARPSRIAGLIGIAAAPDFTETLIWNELDKSQQQEMKRTGKIALPNPYADEDVVYPYSLITDGRNNLVMNAPVNLTMPVCLFHGIQDNEVPWRTAISLSETLVSEAITLHLDKSAGHRFSSPEQLAAICQAVRVMRADIKRAHEEMS